MFRAILLLPLLGGCWPLIPGPYADYADDTGSVDTDDTDTTSSADLPSGAALVGFMEWTEYRGNYWSDASDGDLGDGLAVWGVTLEGSASALTPFEGGPCHAMPNWDWTDYWVPFDADSQAVLSGAEDYTLPWQSSASAYAFSLDDGQGFPEGLTWDLEPLETEWGTLAVEDLVRTPTPATLTSPRLEGTSASEGTTPDTLAKSDFTFEWTGNSGEAIVLQMQTVDAQQNALDQVACLRRSGSSLTVPSGVFDDLASAGGAYVWFGTAVESSGSVGGGGENRSAGIQWQQGFVYLE